MTTITVQTHVGPDGKLRLEVPSGLSEGPVEAVIVLQPAMPQPASGYRDVRTGILDGTNLSDIDIDTDLKEMNRQWQSKLDNL